MPISRLLADKHLPADQQHKIELAFNYTLRKLSLVDRNDPICRIVARKVYDIAKSGVTDAVAIGELAYKQLSKDNPA